MAVGDLQRRTLGNHHFARPQPGEFGGQVARPHRHRLEPAGRNVGGGQPQLAFAARLGERDQHIVAPAVEQGFLGQRAGGDIADDGACHERLAAPCLGLGRRLGLLGDGDAMAALDQPGEIGFGAMHRHAAHRDRLPGMFATAGERNVERRGRHLGVIEEEFEEIAHAVEEQAILRLCLEGEILCHHGGRLGGGGGRIGHGASG